jgi:hypothetical protein
MSELWANLGALVPSVGVLAIFVVVVRSMILADRRERTARALEDEELKRKSAP